jgi:hypothetical protein
MNVLRMQKEGAQCQVSLHLTDSRFIACLSTGSWRYVPFVSIRINLNATRQLCFPA